MLTGRSVDAAEALTMGLVNRVVDDTDVDAVAGGLAEEIASLPAGAAAATKSVLLAGLTADLAGARRSELRTLGAQAKRLAARPTT